MRVLDRVRGAAHDPLGDLAIAEEKQRAFRLAQEVLLQAEATKATAQELLRELGTE